MHSGGGTRATKRPKASGDSDQTSSSIAAPRSCDAHQAGLGGRRVGQRVEAVGGRGPRGAHEAAAAVDQLVVQRLARQVRADDGDRRSRPSPDGARRRRRARAATAAGSRPSSATSRRCSADANDASDGVAAPRRDQRRAGRQAVGAEPGRHRQRRQVEQVDEVRVGAEQRVEPQRLGLDLVDRVDGRRRRDHQEVDAGEQRAPRAGAASRSRCWAANAARASKRAAPSRMVAHRADDRRRVRRASRPPAASRRSATNGPS